MDDLISRKALLAAYDRVHIGEPGMARKLMEDAPTVDAVEVVHGQRLYNAHEVAEIIAELFGDCCACNFNGIDEWLPLKCELQEACPHPCGVACWEQYLKYKDRKEETLKKYGFTLEAKYKEA